MLGACGLHGCLCLCTCETRPLCLKNDVPKIAGIARSEAAPAAVCLSSQRHPSCHCETAPALSPARSSSIGDGPERERRTRCPESANCVASTARVGHHLEIQRAGFKSCLRDLSPANPKRSVFFTRMDDLDRGATP